MIRRAYVSWITLLALSAHLATPGNAAAQTIGDEARCRDTIVKLAAKLQATVAKAQRKCVKDTLKGKMSLAAGQKCHQALVADTNGKILKIDAKLQERVGETGSTKCDQGADLLTLAGHGPKCAVGVNDQELLVTTFDDVSDCVASAAIGSAELVFGEILNPDYGAIARLGDPKLHKKIRKCADAIAKNGVRLLTTIAKARRKTMKIAEKKGALSSNLTPTYPEYGQTHEKIDKAVAKLTEQIDKRCVGPNDQVLGREPLRLLGSCATTVAGIKACVEKAVSETGDGFVGLMYVNPNKPPVGARIRINSGSTTATTADPPGEGKTPRGEFPEGLRNRTALEVGFSGLAHDSDIVDGFEMKIDLDCDDGGICDITASCEEGNCRCADDPVSECDEPFGTDVDDCGGADCLVYFGPPLPLNVFSTPLCNVNTIESLSGMVDRSNGNTLTNVQNLWRLFLGFAQSQPCPTCESDTTANDGVADGTCDGGVRDGLACDANATHPTFGPTSYACQPDLVELTGSNGLIGLGISDEPDDLEATISCGGGLTALDCHCRVCTGGGDIPCNDDLDCPGAETCTTNGPDGVAQVLPNGCIDLADSFVCGSETPGACENTKQRFCDGMLRANGLGILNCFSNADCDAIGPECPDDDCGDCTIEVGLPCFDPVINASSLTNAGTDHAVVGAAICVAPSRSGAVNAEFGLPGPGRVVLDMDIDVLCPDGVTESVYGGTNCP